MSSANPFFISQFSIRDWRKIESAIEAKSRYLRAKNLQHLPQIFETGDKVGFFRIENLAEPLFGTIIADDANAVSIGTSDGRLHLVSPFLIFHICSL